MMTPLLLLLLLHGAGLTGRAASIDGDGGVIISNGFIFNGFVPDSSGSTTLEEPRRRLRDDPTSHPTTGKTFPTILTHGMGDSCFNPGFSQLVALTAERTGSPAYCVGAGPTLAADTLNTFVTTMDEQLDYFVKQVQSNPNLAHGFNAIGLSQGNLIIRAYIHRYNFPPVKNFISIHGPQAGVAALPRCNPTSGGRGIPGAEICDLIDSLVGALAYNPEIQTALAQSNYFRDPFHLVEFNRGCLFLPDILDKAEKRPQYAKNMATISSLNLVMAKRDTMIFPKESEYFGTFKEFGYNEVVEVENMPFYESLGLRTLDEAGRITRFTTEGDHLQFSQKQYYQWIDWFFKGGNDHDEVEMHDQEKGGVSEIM